MARVHARRFSLRAFTTIALVAAATVVTAPAALAAPPNVPDQLSVNGQDCAAHRYVPTLTPTVRARISDPDQDVLGARFEWARLREDGTRGPVADSSEQRPVGNGATAQTTPARGVLDRSETIVGTGDPNRDGRLDVLARDDRGHLFLFPGNGTGLGERVQLSTGWKNRTIAGVADWDADGELDVIAREGGDLYVFRGFENRVKVASRMAGLTFAGVADWDRDGKVDLVAADPWGRLWLHPSLGTNRVLLASGWRGHAFYGVADRTGDGVVDIVSERQGTLWLTAGNGKRAPLRSNRQEIGTGWAGVHAFAADFDADQKLDLIAGGSTAWRLHSDVVGAPRAIASVGLGVGSYSYRVSAGDGTTWSAPTAWCDFTTDVTAPPAPVVTGDVYKPTGCPAEGCGGVGVEGTFTFSSSPDVVRYKWGFTDPPTTEVPAGTPVRWAPTRGGPHNLYVEAIDRAGLSARTIHQFIVATPSSPVGRWLFEDATSDATGQSHDLTSTVTEQPGRTAGGMPSYGFDGTATTTASTAKVLNTASSFTVSAWVRLTDGTADRAILSQGGFRLGYDATSSRWQFSLTDNGTASANAAVGVWTHVIGVYDSAAGRASLHVDGVLQDTATATSADVPGDLMIGRDNSGRHWQGDVWDVVVWKRTITAKEIADLVDVARTSEVGRWRFDEGAGGVASDSSAYAHDIRLVPGVGWGAGLRFSGTASVSTAEPVLYTDQSFTVDVVARPGDAGVARTLLSHHGPSSVDPFVLRYDGAGWSAEMSGQRVTAVAADQAWTRLTVVYDAAARTLSLYLNGTLSGSVSGVRGSSAEGVLTIGGRDGSFWLGEVDELNAYQGVLPPR